MCKTKLNSSLQYNNNENESAQTHRDNPWPDQSQNTSRLFIPEEAGDTTISSASSFSTIYGILSEIDRNFKYIKLKTNTTETTYYIQNSLFNPKSSLKIKHQFYSIIPLSLQSQYVVVFLDSSNKVIDVQRFLSQKIRDQFNIPLEPTKYSFPDKQKQKQNLNTPEPPLDLFSEYDEPEPDLLLTDPLYPSYQNMPNYIPYSIKPENFLKYNYVFNIKLNSKHPNAFFIREVCFIFSQLLLGNAHFISAVAPTKMTHSKFLLIKSNYELLNSLYNKTQNILKDQNVKRQQLAYIFYSLQYITEGYGTFSSSYSSFIKQYQSDKSLSQNLPNRQTLIQQIKDYSQQLSTLLKKAKHNYEIALKYKSKFNEEPYGELHIHGFLQDLYNFNQNCNYDYKFDKYGRKIYIIPINYTYKNTLKSSKVELCIQPIDSKRYNSKLKSIENLLNYFYGPQNQPTFYFSTQTFDNYNGSSVLRNIPTTQFQFKANNQTIVCIKYNPTLLQCFSNQIPTFNLPGDHNDHTLFDFWPELNSTLDKLFPNLYNTFPEIFPDPKNDISTVPKPDIPLASKIFNRYIYQYNASYSFLFYTFPETPDTPKIPKTQPELIPTIYRLSEISSTAKSLYIFILSHFYANNYDAFTKLQTSTTLLANSNPENNIYKIAPSTVPSIQTLAEYIQIAENQYGKSIYIHPSPDETLAENPAQYWQLFSGLDESFEALSIVPELEANLSQHNKLCLEASRTLQNQFSLSTNIINHVQPENGLESLLEPLNAKLKNYDLFTPDCLSSRLTLFSQIYKNSSFSSFSLISHKTNQICIKIHQNIQNYIIPYIDTS